MPYQISERMGLMHKGPSFWPQMGDYKIKQEELIRAFYQASDTYSKNLLITLISVMGKYEDTIKIADNIFF